MINKKHQGAVIDVIADRNYDSGDIIQLEKVKGVAVVGVTEGEMFAVDTQGVFEYPHDGKLKLYEYAYVDAVQKLKSAGNPSELFGVVVKLDGDLCWVKILQNFHQPPKKEASKS